MRAAILIALAACGGSKSDKDGVAVSLASVTLADDCGEHGYRPPPAEPPPEARQQRGEAAASESVADRSAGALYSGCSQTSIQISFSADHATPVRIKVVELLDGRGRYLQDLPARSPSRWDGSKYVAWDEKLEPTKPVSASYALAAPKWELVGGRSKAQGQTLNVHVVVVIGTIEHSLEKQFVMPVQRSPDVVTLR